MITLPAKLIVYLVLELQLPTHVVFHLNEYGLSNEDLELMFLYSMFMEIMELFRSSGCTGIKCEPDDKRTRSVLFTAKGIFYTLNLSPRALYLFSDGGKQWRITVNDSIKYMSGPFLCFNKTYPTLENWLTDIKTTVF